MEEAEKKRPRIISEDRLSNLPDDIIRHILSFLDTKHAVQSSVLSKDWMFHWKHVHELNFDSKSFANLPSFKKFLSSVLRCRPRSRCQHRVNNCIITKLRYDSRSYDGSLVDRIVRYAVAHSVEHLIMKIPRKRRRFLLKSMPYKALNTLELGGFYFRESFPYSGITTLCLYNCGFCDSGDDFDVFAACHSLKNLSLVHCTVCTVRDRLFKISASQLIKLTIITQWLYFPNWKFQIFAPQLEYFGYNWNEAKVLPKSGGHISQYVEFVSINSQCRISVIRNPKLDVCFV